MSSQSEEKGLVWMKENAISLGPTVSEQLVALHGGGVSGSVPLPTVSPLPVTLGPGVAQ